MENAEFMQSFVEEAKSHLEVFESGLLKMDAAAADSESINNIFRAVHSIKGTAGFFNLSKIVELAHAVENLFGEYRSGKRQITSEAVDLLLLVSDCLKSMVDDVVNSDNADISGFMSSLSELLGPKPEEVGASGAGSASGGGKEGAGRPGIFGPAADDAARSGMDRIADLVRRGHIVYKVRRSLKADFANKGANLAGFVKRIKSMGCLIDCHMDMDGGDGACAGTDAGTGGAGSGDKSDTDIVFVFILTSVLEMDLLLNALDIPQHCVEKQDIILEAGAASGTGDHSEPGVSSGTASEAFYGASSGVPSGAASMHAASDSRGKEHENAAAPDAAAAGRSQAAIAVEDSIRVHVRLLNNLLNLASEMVLGRNQLLRAMEDYKKSIPGMETILQNIDHITSELQEKIMQTRMQPVSIVFSKFPRIIREISKKLEKDMELKLEGVDVELDKSIIEALGDPLTHLVRNAADHGIELPAEREKAGKSRGGTILMKAYHEGGYVNIDIIDDGKGIDIEKVKQKAIERDLISKADASSITEQEALQLLFKPGFSTADKVTDISGRGVGMDVVKTNIEKLGGTIEIFTSPGKGSTFRLLLPLTLAIIPSLIVEVEKQKFALPQVNLQEIVRIKPGDASRHIEYINNAEVLRLRGRLLPIVHLADVLGLKRTYVDPLTGEAREDRRTSLFDRRAADGGIKDAASGGAAAVDESRSMIFSNIVRILVIKIGSKRLGIAVNAIHGGEEILVKPLPVHIKNCKCYSGVTILGDGRTVMILDPGGIIEKANLRYLEGQEEAKLGEASDENQKMREKQSLLIFKCSGPETLAVDLSMVSRVEEIGPEEIESIGDREYIKFRGETLRVVRPESFLPIGSREGGKGKMFVIIPKLVKRNMGILIEKIHDTVSTSVSFKQDDFISKGFIGSTILNGRIVLIVNIYELFEQIDPEHYGMTSSMNEGEKMTVLLAEDTPFFQKLEKDYLESAGYHVLMAQDGKEALNVLQKNKADAVVSDIVMPVMDGLELVKRIRRDEGLRDLPVIAVTSISGEQDIRRGLEAGFDAYEIKLDRVRLLETLDKAIQKRRKAV